ncbi:kunitz trypsin inhibitor 5-like [Diospyros lotus]|uniref:kunitz trypsin inhibitor 5-like n=1 Tax=Diospyros lotus TaxID=55363 RepID=UPI0022511FED|nr:kunitz trypsin inhibitor 5-like [Diospyros lotus]
MASPSPCTQTPLLLLLLLLLCLSVSAPFHLLVAADSSPDAVRDIDGQKLRAGTQYYILPVFRGKGGGVTLGPRNATFSNCPLDVVQDRSEVSKGHPVTFTPVDPKKGFIRLSTDLNVEFSPVETICAQYYSTVWRLDKHDGRYLISTGGVGRETLSNSFKIKKQDDDYKLFYCPTVCNYYARCKNKGKVICKDVGIYIDRYGTRHLALSDKPFRVMFKKAAA